MEKQTKESLIEKIERVVKTPLKWQGSVWYGEYRSHDDIQNVRYSLYCKIPRTQNEFIFLDGQCDWDRWVKLYIARYPTEKEVENEAPLPQCIVFSKSPEAVEAYAKSRELSRKRRVPDFEEKTEIKLNKLPKQLTEKLHKIALSFYESYQ